MSNLGTSIADQLSDGYKPRQCGAMLLAFTIPHGLDCVLERASSVVSDPAKQYDGIAAPAWAFHELAAEVEIA